VVSIRRALVMLVALVGCGAPSEVTMTFEGPSSAFFEAQEAAAEWNVCPGISVHITREPGHDSMRVVAADDDVLDGLAGVTKWNVVGAARVYVDERAARRSVFAHEIGHVLGRDHGASGVMQDPPERDAHVDLSDCP